ncbi:hypothetical protein BaRGS_00028189, partial [Batillaria attramentaria]
MTCLTLTQLWSTDAQLHPQHPDPDRYITPGRHHVRLSHYICPGESMCKTSICSDKLLGAVSTMSLLLIVGLVLMTTPGSDAFRWTQTFEDNAYVAACVNGTTNLPWSFTKDTGETVESIHWYFHGENPEKLIALHSANYFFAVPEFSERVQFLDNGGLIMRQLSVEDSGKYSVQISVSDRQNVVSDHMRAAYLEVSDGVHVVQEQVAVLDPETGSRHVTLKCGPIVSQMVDETKGKARFALLEAENTDLKTLVNTLASKVDNNSATL